MFTLYLKDFITKGTFGPVKLGMTPDEAIFHLGPPDQIGEFSDGFRGLYYAWYELFYHEDSKVINGIQNDHLATFPNIRTKRVNNKVDICYANDHFTIDIWFLKKNRYLTYADVLRDLKKESIDFEVTKDFFGNDILRFPSGVTMDFSDSGGSTYCPDTNTWIKHPKIDNPDEFVLNGVRLFDFGLG